MWLASSQTGSAAGQLALERQTAHAFSMQTRAVPMQSSSPSQLPASAVHSLRTQTPSWHGLGLLDPIFVHSSAVTQHAFELGPASSSPTLAGRGKSQAASRMDTTRSLVALGVAIAQMLVDVAPRVNEPGLASCCMARCRTVRTLVTSVGMRTAIDAAVADLCHAEPRRSRGAPQHGHAWRVCRRRQMKNTGTPTAMIAEPLIALAGSSMNRFTTIPVPAATNTSGTIG
jgi:hypothetical protein